MFRFLIMSAAFCALLLLAYVTMNKGKAPQVGMTKTAAEEEVSPVEEINKLQTAGAKTDDALGGKYDAPKPQAIDEKAELNENLEQPQKGKPKEKNINMGMSTDGDKPELTQEKDTEKPFNDKYEKPEKWAMLDETQKVLTEAGEMLESLLKGGK